MAYERQYTQGVGWENEPSINTPISAENLNQMDAAIQDVDEAAYNEFLAVYAAIAQAGGGNAVNFYIDNASNNTLASTSSVLANITLKKDDIIFLYMSVDGDYTQAQTGWKVEYKMYVSDTLTTLTAAIRDYLHGEGAMWHEGLNLDLARGTWLILRVVDTTHFDCIGKIDPASGGGGASTLEDLTDTNIVSPVNWNVLRFEETSGKWVNSPLDGPCKYFADNATNSETQILLVSDKDDFLHGEQSFSEGDMVFLCVNEDCVYSQAYQFFDGWLMVFADHQESAMRLYDYRDATQGIVPFDDDIDAGTILVFAVEDTKLCLNALITPASGGGTTVVANPTGTATDTLVKLQVGSTIYEIPGIDTAWAGKVTAVSGGNITPNNASFSFDPFTDGKFVILDIGVDAVMPGSVTSWSLQYTVDGNTVTRGISDKRNGNAYDPDFDDDLVSGSVIVLQFFGDNKFACVAVLNESGGGGASTLAALTDTNIVTPSDGQLLTYDATSGKWINASAGGGTGVLTYEIVTKSTGGTNAAVTVNKYVNKSRKASTDYLYTQAQTPVTIDDKIVLDYGSTASGKWTYTLLEASKDHAVGYSDSWAYSATVSKIEEYESQENPDTLDAIDDVNLTFPFGSGQPITFDATSGKWANGGVIPIANGGTGNAEGYIQTGIKANTVAATRATIEGIDNTTSGVNSHVEGISNTISAGSSQAHAEGGQNTVSGQNAHAEGGQNKATANQAHAEGYGTTASGQNSHTQNTSTTASGASASAAGSYTTAGYANQFVVGKYNNNKSTSIFEVGIGANANAKANGLELDGSGNLTVAGSVTDGDGNVLGGSLTASDVQDIKDAFVVPTTSAQMPILFDETGAEYIVGWYKLANGTKKPVYQKTYMVNTFTINTTKSSVTIDDFSSKTLLDATGFCKWGSASQMRVLSFVHAQANNEIYAEINITDNNLILECMRQQGSTTLTDIVIKAIYTKTTDTPV